MSNLKEGILFPKGTKSLCLKGSNYGENGLLIKGNEYFHPEDNCITDENGKDLFIPTAMIGDFKNLGVGIPEIKKGMTIDDHVDRIEAIKKHFENESTVLEKKNWKDISRMKTNGAEIISINNTTPSGIISDEYEVTIRLKKSASTLTEQRVFENIQAMLLDIKSYRKNSGFKTLRDVEERTGISNAYLSQLESGKLNNPSWKVVKSLYCLFNGVEFPMNVTAKLIHCFSFQNKLNETSDNCVICGKTKNEH
jgi:DNA-binding XRE family transcriptional regulator